MYNSPFKYYTNMPDTSSNLVRKSVMLKLPPLPPMPKPANLEKDKNVANERNGKGAEANSSSRSKQKASSNHRM